MHWGILWERLGEASGTPGEALGRPWGRLGGLGGALGGRGPALGTPWRTFVEDLGKTLGEPPGTGFRIHVEAPKLPNSLGQPPFR